MKKLISFSLTILISATLFGQFHFGPQIGYTASNLSVSADSITNGLKNNFLAGIFLRIGKKIYVEPQVNWLTQGSVFKYPKINNLLPLEQKIKLNTIQVPLNVGWRIINLKVMNIRIFGGVAANFIMNTTIDNSGGSPADYEKLLLPDDFSKVQWQWNAGVGVDVLMFAVNVSYMGGINNILKDVSITSKSNLFVVTVGWKIL